ncbi:MAG TPA: DUF6265 family protein [Anaerolineae bacterium]
MKMAIASLIMVLISVCLGQEKTASGKSPRDVSLADLGFISGHSRGEIDGGTADEHWSEPAGDSMMGVYRYIKGGKVQMYELLVIEQTAKGPVLRLRHFNPGLKSWEEKPQVWNYSLIRWTKGEAVFGRPDKGTRITYRAGENGVLQSTRERTGKKTEVFQYSHSPD